MAGGMTMHNFELLTARLFHHKRPALIPGMDPTAGNKLLATRLWDSLHYRYMQGGTIEQLGAVAVWFADRHPNRVESCIRPVVNHFELLMGLAIYTDQDYTERLSQHEPELQTA
jgi:hypothetical protein